MTKDEMEALLAVPDRRTKQGRVQHALLLFLHNTGARVSEATRLEVGNLQISRHGDNHALVTLCGKRERIRQCPLRFLAAVAGLRNRVALASAYAAGLRIGEV